MLFFPHGIKFKYFSPLSRPFLTSSTILSFILQMMMVISDANVTLNFSAFNSAFSFCSAGWAESLWAFAHSPGYPPSILCFSIMPVRKLNNDAHQCHDAKNTFHASLYTWILPPFVLFLLCCSMPIWNHFKQWWCLSFVLLCVCNLQQFSSAIMIPTNNTHMNILLPFSW